MRRGRTDVDADAEEPGFGNDFVRMAVSMIVNIVMPMPMVVAVTVLPLRPISI